MTPRQRIEAIVARAVPGLLGAMPPALAARLAGGIAGAIGPLLPVSQIARTNLCVAMPDTDRADQRMNDGVEVCLFGRPAMTASALAALAGARPEGWSWLHRHFAKEISRRRQIDTARGGIVARSQGGEASA
jgi:lauroyl/myristoyl acyltransferase